MVVLHTCLIAVLLGLADATSTHRQLSRNVASKFFLQAENTVTNVTAEIEAVVSDAAVALSKDVNGARAQRFRKEFDTSWQNNLVIIPCLIVGSPLFYIWYHLEPVGKGHEIYTALDADLREVEIARVGASGVALLRRQCDRHTGIVFAFTGIMLQTIFLYFIAVFCCERIVKQFHLDNTGNPTPIALLFCSLFCNTMTCCASLIMGLKCWATTAPEGYEQLHKALVCLDSFVIPTVCVIVGSLYLCTSNGITSLVFSATSMAFICSINMQIAGLMSWSLSGHGGRAFQPANVSIKDSENSTIYAHWSFIAALVVAIVTLPLGFVLGII